MKTLRVEPLTKAAFAPFGDVIEAAGAETREINLGFALRRHDLAKVDVGPDGKALISIFEARRRPFPIEIDMMERHPLGSQAIHPLSSDPWLVVVAEGGDAPNLMTLRCFRTDGRQGVNYAANVWHFPVLTLAPTQDFLVVDRGGPGENLEERFFEGVTVDLAPTDQI